MNKLSKKFILGIAVILSLSCLFTILFNTNFLEKYYLFQKRNTIVSICSSLTDSIRSGSSSDTAIEQMEDSHKVIIVKIDNPSAADPDTINDQIRDAFQTKGIGFQKYWLWEKDYEKILDGETRIRLYKQENLNYSLLVEYIQINGELFAVTMIIPNIADAFGIINNFLIFVNVASILFSIIFLAIFIKRITKPLQEFKIFASHMENNTYIPLEIHTKDELQAVAESLNNMGGQIITYQKSLQEKNDQMELLLDNVAHDLKTPISLIQLYAAGMKDGLDDGTFLDTIEAESAHMAQMADQLLYVSRIAKKDTPLASLNVTTLLQELTEKYAPLAKENKMFFSCTLENDITIISSRELLTSLFTNLLTNAVKYSSGTPIQVTLKKDHTTVTLSVTNKTTNNELDLSQIWTPYYVGEQSRNKTLSGTGLGLTIVSKICQKLHYNADCTLKDGEITFLISIPLPR